SFQGAPIPTNASNQPIERLNPDRMNRKPRSLHNLELLLRNAISKLEHRLQTSSECYFRQLAGSSGLDRAKHDTDNYRECSHPGSNTVRSALTTFPNPGAVDPHNTRASCLRNAGSEEIFHAHIDSMQDTNCHIPLLHSSTIRAPCRGTNRSSCARSVRSPVIFL